MADQSRESDELDVPRLLSEIASDSLTLLSQQAKLLQAEVGSEIARAARAGLLAGAGAALIAGGGVLSSVALVHLLHRRGRIPLWASYGLAAGLSASAGLSCWIKGTRLLNGVQLTSLPQTQQALQENLTWLRDQLTPSAP